MCSTDTWHCESDIIMVVFLWQVARLRHRVAVSFENGKHIHTILHILQFVRSFGRLLSITLCRIYIYQNVSSSSKITSEKISFSLCCSKFIATLLLLLLLLGMKLHLFQTQAVINLCGPFIALLSNLKFHFQ